MLPCRPVKFERSPRAISLPIAQRMVSLGTNREASSSAHSVSLRLQHVCAK